MKIIKESELKTNVEYCVEWDCPWEPGSGWSFDCDKNGNVLKPNENLDKLKSGKLEGIYKGIKKYSWTYLESAIGKCDCGCEVELHDPLDNVCSNCGECFNSSGQNVTPSWKCDNQGNPYDCEF